MPTLMLTHIVVVAIIAAVCALAVSLALHFLGLDRHIPIAAAVSASSAAVVASTTARRARRLNERRMR